MQWVRHAGRLSADCFSVDADWARVVAMIPHHTFILRWWESSPGC